MSLASLLLVPSAFLYGLGLVFSRHATDYRDAAHSGSKREQAGSDAAAEAGVHESLLPSSDGGPGEHLPSGS